MMAVCSGSASGALVAYEGFDYSAGTDIDTQTGGSSWNAGWSSPTGVSVDNPVNDLTYTGLPTIGNSLTNPLAGNVQNIERTWNATDLTGDGGEIWFSLMVNQASGSSDAGDELRFQIFQGGDSPIRNNGSDTMLSIDENGSLELWGMSGTTANATTSITTGANHLLVGQYIFSDTAGSDVWNLWVDPTIAGSLGAATLSATGDIQLDGEADGLASEILDLRFLRNEMNLDEIRIGTDYASVIPEPTTSGLAALGTALIFARRRRSIG